MRYLYNPPWIIKRLFSDFLWETSNEQILLTFDDGPNPGTTEKLLDLLKEKKVKALFFCLGENVKKYPGLCQKIIDDGHSIGNHTYTHKRINEVSKEEIDKELSLTNKLLKEEFHYEIKYFRPPHGRFTFSINKILRKHNLKNVMWSLLTWDYKGDYNVVKKSVLNCLKKNSIIVLHDSEKTKNILLDTVNLIIEEAGKRNYKIGEPSTCLK